MAFKEDTNQVLPGSQLISSANVFPSYVIITAARNEAHNIRRLLNCVISQDIKPIKWVIVSDGSQDGTDNMVKEYCSVFSWIELLRMPDREERHFGGKASAINFAYRWLNGLCFDLIGSIDADISFDKDFFAFLLEKFSINPRLGVAGTPFKQDDLIYDFRFSSVNHVSGACQLFRRGCFEEIGGYVPAKSGGIDVIAVLSARMLGWEARTFTEKFYFHHRKMGAAKSGIMRARYLDGGKDYSLGAHPIWVLFRSIYQMTKKPLFLGGILLITGYFVSLLRRDERVISRPLMDYRRKDQMRRLRAFVISMLN